MNEILHVVGQDLKNTVNQQMEIFKRSKKFSIDESSELRTFEKLSISTSAREGKIERVQIILESRSKFHARYFELRVHNYDRGEGHSSIYPLNKPETFFPGELSSSFLQLHRDLRSWILKEVVPTYGNALHCFQCSQFSEDSQFSHTSHPDEYLFVRYPDAVIRFEVDTCEVEEDSMFKTSISVLYYDGRDRHYFHTWLENLFFREILNPPLQWKALIFTTPQDKMEEYQQMIVAFACSQHARLGMDSRVPKDFPLEMLQTIFRFLPEPPKVPRDIFDLLFAGLEGLEYMQGG
jgi:hypothetical protein